VLVLKEMEGQKYEDIAEVLDVPIGTVRSRLHRARMELRDLLHRPE
jgi:RNA polymerase sigma-70 factor (ECF subfamily)